MKRIAVFFVEVWYRTCLLLTKTRTKVKFHSSYKRIAEELSWGKEYTPDPVKGLLDVITHPSRVQRRVNAGMKVGDCDDHAAYWAAAVEDSELCIPGSARLGFVRYRNKSGKLSGHVVALWKDKKTGVSLWADYAEPTEFFSDDWSKHVCAKFGTKYRWSAEVLTGHFTK